MALLSVAGYELATALRAKEDSNPDCYADGCNPVGLQKRGDAVSSGQLATIFGVSGAVLVGAGAAMFLVGCRADAAPREGTEATEATEGRTVARLTWAVAPGVAVLGIDGRF